MFPNTNTKCLMRGCNYNYDCLNDIYIYNNMTSEIFISNCNFKNNTIINDMLNL